MNDIGNVHSSTKEIRKGLINEVVNQLIIIEGAKEQIKAIQEVAVDKFGDNMKSLPSWGAAVYKATYNKESYEKSREKKEMEFEIVDELEQY